MKIPIEYRQITATAYAKGKSYALWRMPMDDRYWICAGDLLFGGGDQPLGKMDAGFVLCAFANRPTTKAWIRGEMLASARPQEGISYHASEMDISQPNANKFNYHQGHYVKGLLPDFEGIVSKAIHQIKQGTFEKVVLSRYQDHQIERAFDPLVEFEKLGAAYPTAFVSLVSTPNYGTWMGASPETLVEVNAHGMFRTVSLAGTQKALPDQPLSHVMWRQKEIEEQALVSRYIINCFKKIRLREYREVGPRTVQAGSLLHLKTDFEVDTHAVGYDGLANDMLALLHPTSAVCGMPKPQAMSFIEEEEGYDRSLYSGFIGPVNVVGHTQLFVNLRCMSILKGHLRFYAGGGITQDSDPSQELEETRIKMKVLSSIVLPALSQH